MGAEIRTRDEGRGTRDEGRGTRDEGYVALAKDTGAGKRPLQQQGRGVWHAALESERKRPIIAVRTAATLLMINPSAIPSGR